jgi:hypothetical protein
MMNKLAMINSCEIILEKSKIVFLPKIIVKFKCTLYLCALYSVKYGIQYRPWYVSFIF